MTLPEKTQTSSPAWEVDDSCLFAFREASVAELDPSGLVTAIACGVGTLYASDLTNRIFPIDAQGEAISATYKLSYERLHREARPANLNYPDINRWFEQSWEACMRDRHDASSVEQAYNTLEAFVQEALSLASDQQKITVQGVRLFR